MSVSLSDSRQLGPNARRMPRPRRIVIVSAGMGAGHDGAADELGRGLESLGFTVARHDFLDLMPLRTGRLLAATYRDLLTWAPAGYQRVYRGTERASRPGPVLRALLRGAERRTLAAIPADTAAVVSTYPGASQVLGRLRTRGDLAVPAATYLTDFSVHPLWVAPGIDMHLAVHPVPAGQAEARGAAGIRVCGPAVSARFAPAAPSERRRARVRFGLDAHAPLALLVAGSWGVGDLEQAAADVRDSGVATPVVVCGRNETLAGRLRARGVEHVHGWVDDMPGLMHACDVLVQNAGGLTSLESFAGGLPVVSYRCIPGHGQTNAAALHEAGLAVWIRHPAHLGAALQELLHGTRGSGQRARGLALFRSDPGPAQAIAEMAGGHVPAGGRTRAPAQRGRRRIGVPALATAAALTALLGVGAPLAEAYGDSPGGLTSLTRVLDGARR